jgi:hypothetical protein
VPGQTRHKLVFVLKDCRSGGILPGEWQHPVFAQSINPKIYVEEHIERFGYYNFASTRNKRLDDDWIYDKLGVGEFGYTKTLGPSEYTIEICGRSNFCARHELTPGSCCESRAVLLASDEG